MLETRKLVIIKYFRMHSQTYQASPTKGQEQQTFHRGLVEEDYRYRSLWDYGALKWSSKEELGFTTKVPALKGRELFHDEYHPHSYPFIPLLTYNSLSYIPRVVLLRIHFPLPDYDGKRTLRYQDQCCHILWSCHYSQSSYARCSLFFSGTQRLNVDRWLTSKYSSHNKRKV